MPLLKDRLELQKAPVKQAGITCSQQAPVTDVRCWATGACRQQTSSTWRGITPMLRFSSYCLEELLQFNLIYVNDFPHLGVRGNGQLSLTKLSTCLSNLMSRALNILTTIITVSGRADSKTHKSWLLASSWESYPSRNKHVNTPSFGASVMSERRPWHFSQTRGNGSFATVCGKYLKIHHRKIRRKGKKQKGNTKSSSLSTFPFACPSIHRGYERSRYQKEMAPFSNRMGTKRRSVADQ